jgi:TonB family protein
VVVLAGPRPGPAQDEPKVAGKDVPAPKRTKTVSPEYPAEAQAQGIRGIVLLELLIDTEGKVAQVDVVRSIPGLDDAATRAARLWEYEVTRLDGKPVPVRLTVPITFAMRLPQVTRQEGIPELRSGTTPSFPPGAASRETASVTLEVTLDPDGTIAEARLRAGEEPWSRSLLQALRTWRFEPAADGAIVSFRVEADFIPAAKGGAEHVELRLTGLRRSETAPLAEATALATPAPEAAAPSAPGSAEPGAPPEPEPTASPAAAPAEPVPASGEPSAPAPAAAKPPVTSAPPSAPPAAESAVPIATPAPPVATPAPPPTEVISAPPQQPLSSPPPIEEGGLSAVADVVLQPGVPELVSGRRPVSPPLARMAGATGTVEVRFAVDAAGTPAVRAVEGPDVLKPAAESAVGTWVFRRLSAERLLLKAVFSYAAHSASAVVSPLVEEPEK